MGEENFKIFFLFFFTKITEILKRESKCKSKCVIDDLPVDQVIGFHDRYARTHMHGGTAHVVSVTNTDHGEVRYIGINDRVLGITRMPGHWYCYYQKNQ